MKGKVLIAINDNNLIKTLRTDLTKDGYDVASVTSSDKIIEKLKSYQPDILLIDINISKGKGYEVLNEKSFDREITKIPVIIVSNSGESIHLNKIPSTPTIKDYIIRLHIDPKEVIEKVETALQ